MDPRVFSSTRDSAPTPSLRDCFAPAPLVLVLIRMLHLGRGSREQATLVTELSISKEDYAGCGPEGSSKALGPRVGVGALCHTAVMLQLCSGFFLRSWDIPYVMTSEVWNSAAAAFNFWAAEPFG